ncbi:methyltransferase [Streptomyces sp. NPDC087420]|uniref:methyltransferase n=1 Tax=Streptomyces sp. NPDC087420 TaxID=3365785 RepID=UPI0038323B6C
MSAAPLMRMATGFWQFKTLAVAVELALFTRLSGHPDRTRTELAAALGIEDRPADLLLTACTALGLLEKNGDTYRNAPLAEQFLVEGGECYFGGVVRFNDRAYPAWHDLGAAVRSNRPLTWDPDTQSTLFSSGDPAFTEAFWNGMHSLSAATARVLAQTYDFGPHQRLLDVGGGSGAFVIELCRRHPHLTATLYDLPHVCALAQDRIASAGLAERVRITPGDFRREAELPGGHDLIVLSMILHDWDERDGRALVRKCHDALAPGGVLLVCELLVDAGRTGPLDAALMGVNMLVETAAGRNYGEDEYVEWLHAAGFADTEIVRFDAAGANGVVVARRA